MWLHYTVCPLTHKSTWRTILNIRLHMGRLVMKQFILHCLFVFKLTDCNNVISDCCRSPYCMLYTTLYRCWTKDSVIFSTKKNLWYIWSSYDCIQQCFIVRPAKYLSPELYCDCRSQNQALSDIWCSTR